MNLTALNKQIEFYCEQYPNCRGAISHTVEGIPLEWHLGPTDFPVLVNYLQEGERNRAFGYLSKYDQEWQLGSNLHLIN